MGLCLLATPSFPFSCFSLFILAVILSAQFMQLMRCLIFHICIQILIVNQHSFPCKRFTVITHLSHLAVNQQLSNEGSFSTAMINIFFRNIKHLLIHGKRNNSALLLIINTVSLLLWSHRAAKRFCFEIPLDNEVLLSGTLTLSLIITSAAKGQAASPSSPYSHHLLYQQLAVLSSKVINKKKITYCCHNSQTLLTLFRKYAVKGFAA